MTKEKKLKDIPSDVFESLTKEQQDDIKGQVAQEELDKILKNYQGEEQSEELEKFFKKFKKKGKKVDPKPKKDPVTGAEYLYAKKGGLVKKSKVAGRLAKRGYGKAMKGKK
tara:strand:+ start:3304 stop:3636 length:333 start_codon:yes stop_codon:yes gene_type:complete